MVSPGVHQCIVELQGLKNGITMLSSFSSSHHMHSVFFFLHFFLAKYYYSLIRHHQHGRWQARIGRVAGNKDLYLGTFSKPHI